MSSRGLIKRGVMVLVAAMYISDSVMYCACKLLAVKFYQTFKRRYLSVYYDITANFLVYVSVSQILE